MQASVDVDAESWHAESKAIDERKNPQFECPREETQVGETQQDECSDCRIIRRAKYCGEDACYEY